MKMGADSPRRAFASPPSMLLLLGLLCLLTGSAQAAKKKMPDYATLFAREPAGSVGVTIEFDNENRAQQAEGATAFFSFAFNILKDQIMKKIPPPLSEAVDVNLHATGGAADGTTIDMFISIELPGLVSQLEATKTVRDNVQSEIDEITNELMEQIQANAAAQTAMNSAGIVNITGVDDAEIPSYSFTFSLTLGLQQAAEELNLDEEKLRTMTKGMSLMLSLVGGHIDLVRPASKAVVMDGTNLTINGLFTLDGLSNLPSFAVEAINSFLEDHVNEAIDTLVNDFGDTFQGAQVLDLKLGFGETPDVPETETSDNIVVTIEMNNTEMATTLENNADSINLVLILLQQVVAPPSVIIELADNALSVDGNKVMLKLVSRVLGAASAADADGVIKDFINKIDTELIPAYIEQLNQFVGGSDMGFTTMSIQLGDTVAAVETATEDSGNGDADGNNVEDDANSEESEVVLTVTPGGDIDDDVINSWTAEGGSGNATLDAFVKGFEDDMEAAVKARCQSNNNPCAAAVVKVIGLEPVSSRRKLLATQIEMTTTVSNAPKDTVEVVSNSGTIGGYAVDLVSIKLTNAATRASSLSLGMLAAVVLLAFIQI